MLFYVLLTSYSHSVHRHTTTLQLTKGNACNHYSSYRLLTLVRRQQIITQTHTPLYVQGVATVAMLFYVLQTSYSHSVHRHTTTLQLTKGNACNHYSSYRLLTLVRRQQIITQTHTPLYVQGVATVAMLFYVLQTSYSHSVHRHTTTLQLTKGNACNHYSSYRLLTLVRRQQIIPQTHTPLYVQGVATVARCYSMYSKLATVTQYTDIQLRYS